MSDQETLPVETLPEEKEKGKTRQMSFSVTDDGLIRADFGEGVEPLFCNPGLLPENVLSAATVEGVISRARGYSSRLEGVERTPSALREVTEKAFTNMLAGIWKVERSGPGSTEYTIEVEAAHLFRIMREKSQGKEYLGTMAETAENFAKLTDEQKKTLKALPRYQLALVEVKERKAAEKRAKLEASIKEEEGEDAVF